MSDESGLPEPEFGRRVAMTSVEAFHLYSSTLTWPNCIISRYHFRGAIDVALARKAWLHCLSRQKHAAWRIKTGIATKWDTESRGDIAELAELSFHEVVVDSWPESETDFRIDGVNERGLPEVESDNATGFALWCLRCRHNEKSTLIFAADHVLADGAAAIGFVRDWMMTYHNLATGENIDRGLVKLDWSRWRQRGKLGLLKWSYLKFLPCQAIGLFGATKFVLRKFSTVEPGVDARDNFASPGIVGLSVAPQVVEALNERSERLSVSANSLLMTILFRAMRRIGETLDSETSPTSRWAERKWIRLVLPISIRGIADRKLPCANKASLVQIERTAGQVAHADAASQSIDREIRIIMGFKLDHVFLIAIRLLSLFPALLRFVSRNQKSRGTAVFTNLGEPFRKTRACNFHTVGGLELVDYDLCGPIRCGTPLNFAWSTFRRPVGAEPKAHGRISLHFDRQIIAPATAQKILEAFLKELQDVAQFGGSQA